MPGPVESRKFRAPTEIKTRSDLVHALTEAAELEHSLLLQYLFAGLSLKKRVDEGLTAAQAEMVRSWETTIESIAREEMAHLGTVCNLLTAIGAAPHLTRPPLPVDSRYFRVRTEDGFRFERFSLERLTLGTVERFVRFESPPAPEIAARTLAEPQLEYSTIGELYGQIERAFLTLPEDYLFIGPPFAQDTSDWSRNFRILNVTDPYTATLAIRSVVEEGEGTSTGGPQSHYQRFRAMWTEFGQAHADDPRFDPARPVAANPLTRASGLSPAVVDHPFTGHVSELFSSFYETMLLMLMRHYAFGGDSEEQLVALREATRQMMSGVIRPLAEVLTELPASASRPDVTAGPSFELFTDLRLPAHRGNAWQLIYERLFDDAGACARLAGEVDAPRRIELIAENALLLAEALHRIAPGRWE